MKLIVTLTSGEEVYCELVSNQMNNTTGAGILVSYYDSPHADDPVLHFYNKEEIMRIISREPLWSRY